MEKVSQQLNIRVPAPMLEDLKTIGEYESAKVPELLRTWIRDKIREYRKNRRFEKWRAEKG